MPDLTKDEKIEGLEQVIEGYKELAVGDRPGLAAYAERRIPELEAALARHRGLDIYELV